MPYAMPSGLLALRQPEVFVSRTEGLLVLVWLFADCRLVQGSCMLGHGCRDADRTVSCMHVAFNSSTTSLGAVCVTSFLC